MFRTPVQQAPCDVAVLGGGLAGLATALRLQAAGLSTVVVEAHGHVGGCAGYYRKRGFSFDVGATTLVDFEPGGVGAELLDAAGMEPLIGEALPGYVAWLPDRVVTLHRDPVAWHAERLRAFGDSAAHLSLWALLDRLAETFWVATRNGARMPIRRPADIVHNVRAIGLTNLWLARHVTHTLGDALRARGLAEDKALVALLAMLVEDTVHGSVEEAPLVNAALGITIRGAGLTRPRGGMRGFWRAAVSRYRALGGQLVVGCAVRQVTGRAGDFVVHTARGPVRAAQVVSSLPAETTARVAASTGAGERIMPYVVRDWAAQGGALVVFLGVPEDEVTGPEFTHHQLLQSYDRPLGDGNNMFVSVSAPGDTDSAPPGHRSVMISTHTELSAWEDLDDEAYAKQKEAIGDDLIDYARRVYPRLAERAVVRQIGTPRSYQAYTSRPRGAVGGVRQSQRNSNQNALGHQVGVPGLWLVGDSTWPGLGTVACALGSRIVAEGVLRERRTLR